MINDEYGFDLNYAQARDNLNYEIQSGIRRKKNFNAIERVEKGPKDISPVSYTHLTLPTIMPV